MTRETARAIKVLDLPIIQAAMVLQNLIRDRTKLDRESTENLVREITKSLMLTAEGREK